MENIEVMNYEDVMEPEFEVIETENEQSGIGTAVAMLIGAGLAFATTAAVKFGKKTYDKWKTGKYIRKPDDGEVVEVTDEDIESITK